MQDKLKPVAFLYSREDGSKDLVLDCNGEYARRLLELGATETPLYAHPPTTNPVVVSETPVGDHQMVEAVDRMLIEAIINDYHTTRLDRDYVPHILSKPRTVEAFAHYRQAALTAARAQVEGENQRLREALYLIVADCSYHLAKYRPAQLAVAVAALAAGEHRKDAP